MFLMEGIIVNFKGSPYTQYNNQMIIKIAEILSREQARSLVGKKVTWISPANKKIVGEIRREHGSKGAVNVLFEKSMPGQAIGQKVLLE